MQEMPCALVFALARTSKRNAARMAMMAITTRSSIRVKPVLAEQPAVAWVLRAGQAVGVKFLFISASTRVGFYIKIYAESRRNCPIQAERVLLKPRLRRFGRCWQEQNDIKINDMIHSNARFAENIPACIALLHLPFSPCSNEHDIEAFNSKHPARPRLGPAADLRYAEAGNLRRGGQEISTFNPVGCCPDAAGYRVVPLEPEPGVYRGFRFL